jgi:hypothetical protein
MKNKSYWLLGIMIVLTIFVSISLHQFAKASAPSTEGVQIVKQWTVEAAGANFVAVDMVTTDEGWAVTDAGELAYYDSSQWQIVELENGLINDMDMVSSTEGWAVGHRRAFGSSTEGTLWHYDGTSWQMFPSPSYNTLNKIDMLSASEGYAYSWNEKLFYYNGTVWEQVGDWSLRPPRGVTDLETVAQNDVWLTGDKYQGGYITHFDGTTYQTVVTDTQAINAISFISPTQGWAVGVAGILWHYSGDTWSKVIGPTSNHLYDVLLLSTTNGWAIGDAGTILHYDGSVWQTVVSPVNDTLRAVSMPTANDGWIVGENNTLLRYDGSHWQVIGNALTPGSPTSNALNAVQANPETDSWSVGDSGVILHHTAGEWITATSPVNTDLYAMEMLSPTVGWATGSDGVILYYDGGTWQSATSPTTYTLHALDMVSGAEGWAVGGYSWCCPRVYTSTILHYASNNWQSVASPATRPLFDVAMTSLNEGWAVGGHNASWEETWGEILHYDGNNWQVITTTDATLQALDMISETEGWAVGKVVEESSSDWYTYYTSYGEVWHYDGISWQQAYTIPLSTYNSQPFELNLWDIDMISSDEGWIVGGNDSKRGGPTALLWHYNGDAWQIVEAPTYRELSSVSMLDADSGRVVGANGTILKLQTFRQVSIDVIPGAAATLVYTDTGGLTTTVTLPAGAIVTNTRLVYTDIPTLTHPASLMFAGRSFDLSAYQNGDLLPGFAFAMPVTVTIHYSDSDVVGLSEETLVLHYWNESTQTWEDAACDDYVRHSAENWLSVPICHLSQFALFGKQGVQPASTIIKRVSPEGQVQYGDELTYTLVISGAPGTEVSIYDPLTNTTFLWFAEQPTGIEYANHTITGTMMITPTNQMTVSFVVQVGVPGTVGIYVDVSNTACVYPAGQTISMCKWSNTVINRAYRPHTIFLPLVMRIQ